MGFFSFLITCFLNVGVSVRSAAVKWKGSLPACLKKGTRLHDYVRKVKNALLYLNTYKVSTIVRSALRAMLTVSQC